MMVAVMTRSLMAVAMIVVMVVTMVVARLPGLARQQHIELHGADIRPDHPGGPKLIAFHGQLSQLGSQVIEVQTQIQQRANRHIPADAGKAVKIKRLHG
jgi:hypothetical protein